MKPATEQQKGQTFFMEPKAELELNVTAAENSAFAFSENDSPAQSEFSQNTATHD